MSDPVIEQKFGTVGYERKRSLPQDPSLFGSSHEVVYVYVPFEFSPDEQETESRIQAALAQAKAVVFTELGTEYAADEAGVIREVLSQFPGAVAGPAAPSDAPSKAGGNQDTTPRPSGGSSQFKVFNRIADPAGGSDQYGPKKLANPPWFEAAAAATGDTEFWDDRDPATGEGKVGTNGKQRPWFKTKNLKDAEGRGLPVWGPR